MEGFDERESRFAHLLKPIRCGRLPTTTRFSLRDPLVAPRELSTLPRRSQLPSPGLASVGIWWGTGTLTSRRTSVTISTT